MALDYTGASNGLFTHLGKYVKHFNDFRDSANNPTTGFDADREDILNALNSGPQFDAVEGLSSDFDGWKTQVADQRATLMRYALARLRDPASVLREIGAASNDDSEILRCLFRQMVADSQTIKNSVVAIGSVSADSSNGGDGMAFATNILDGISSPGSRNGIRYPANTSYFDTETELTVPGETMTLECVEAGEIAEFLWRGSYPDPRGPYGIDSQGSGEIGTVWEIHDTTDAIISNADFEEFTTPNVPDGWTIVAGSAGTNILEETSSTNVSHGSSSLRFAATGTTSIEISQELGTGILNGRQRYLVSAQIKADASIAAGTLTIQFEGTGYSAAASEKIEIAAGSLPTAFEISSFFVSIPAGIPRDFKLVVRWSGTPTTGKNVYIDDIGIAPVSYGGGVGIAIVRGSTEFSRGDRFSFTVANTEGVFQKAFRELFGVQLPSASTPTIADSLAT